MRESNPQVLLLKPLLASGLIFAFVALLFDFRSTATLVKNARNDSENCQEVVKAGAALSREQLARLLTIPERDQKTKVREMLDEPYCRLPGLEVRAGVTAERESYPLAFDPQTKLVILYESDEYAGYRFSYK
ncbi:MAG: hypothetical protein F6K19_00680 [Cyanothece sp. SIO1E1]|nr:hypothetical protein [Cyanothece sp. SIO1E1]